MIFASRAASDLPWQVGQAVTVAAVEGGSIVTRRYAQHNEPNPILIEFRSAWNVTYPEWRVSQAESYLTYLDGDVYDWRRFPSEVHDHARRVLSRLAGLREAP
jgi:hypothetical protein